MPAPVLSCVLDWKPELEGRQKRPTVKKICQGIEGLNCSIDEWHVYIEGEVDPKIFIEKLYNERSYVEITRYQIDYGYEKNPEGTRKPNSHHFMRCTFELNTLEESWYNKIIAALKTIQDSDVSFTMEYQIEYQMGCISGSIEFGMIMKMLAKTGIKLSRMEYGLENEDPNMIPPPRVKLEAPLLSCVLGMNRELEGWQTLRKICQGIEGLKCSIVDGWHVYIEGEVDPKIFIKKLYNARSYVLIYRIEYGYEKNPEGTRKPNPHHFMRCTFGLNTLEESWYKKIIAALKAIQGASFTIDTPQQMGYFSGSIEFGMLMKMFAKTGIELLIMGYGPKSEDPSLMPPPPVKLEAPANGTETQKPAKDTVPPPPPEVPSTSSTHLHVKYKKPRGFARFCCF